jgi:hypothetical protein
MNVSIPCQLAGDFFAMLVIAQKCLLMIGFNLVIFG